MKFLVYFLLAAAVALAESRTLVLTGTVTNTTGNVSAPARLELTLDGAKISAQLVTSPPLSGTGAMTGECLDGWCDLSGSFGDGFTIKFRGVLSPQDFRGTYTAAPTHGMVQYGRFELAPVAPPAPK